MQHLHSIQYSSGAEPLGSQWMRISPLVLSVRMLEVCTPFRNWIALYNTWGGAGGNNPLNTCGASLFVIYNSCSTNNDLKFSREHIFLLPPAQNLLFPHLHECFWKWDITPHLRSVCAATAHWACLSEGSFGLLELVWCPLGTEQLSWRKALSFNWACPISLLGQERWYWCNTCHKAEAASSTLWPHQLYCKSQYYRMVNYFFSH